MSNNNNESNKSKSVSGTPNNEWAEIMEWLQELNYANYLQLFRDGGYDLWEIIYDLSIDDFKSLGILPGHAKRIQNKLKNRKEQQEKEGKNNKSKIANNANKNTNPNNNSKKIVSNNTNTNNNIQLTQKQQQQQQIAAAQQLQQLAVEERRRKIRERFQQNALFAGGIKNKLFETMTRVLNGLQQELIQYNGKFAEPINEMNQRIVALQKLDVHNLDGIWDSNDGLFEPMMRNVKDIKKFNSNMWKKINEFHNLAELQIKQSMKQLQQQINVINQMKTQYLIKQQQLNAMKHRQRQFNNANNNNNTYKQPPLNTIVTNGSNPTNTNRMSQSPKVSRVNISNINPNQFNYAQFIQQQIVNNTNAQNVNVNKQRNAINMSPMRIMRNPIQITNSTSKNNVSHHTNTNNLQKKLQNKKEIVTNSEASNEMGMVAPNTRITPIKKKKKKKTVLGRKPAYTSGELQMMRTYDKKKQSVADIIELQRNMQSIYGIPRSAYGIAQKMYRMGVLSATLPKKLQALQDKPDADKIKIGDGIMSVRKQRGKPRNTTNNKTKTNTNTNETRSRSRSRSRSITASESCYSSTNDCESSSVSDDDDDDISSNSSSDNESNRMDPKPKAKSNPYETMIMSHSHSPNSSTHSLFNIDYSNMSDTSIPQRKPPSTNLRRYTHEEVHYIRKLIEDYPKEEAKVIFAKFRSRFSYWKDEVEAYTKFYQKKWRLCKEKETNFNHKRKRNSPQRHNQMSDHPPFKKIKIQVQNIMSENKKIPPLITTPKKEKDNSLSFDASAMPTLPNIETKQTKKNDIMPPPLPPPPKNNTNQN